MSLVGHLRRFQRDIAGPEFQQCPDTGHERRRPGGDLVNHSLGTMASGTPRRVTGSATALDDEQRGRPTTYDRKRRDARMDARQCHDASPESAGLAQYAATVAYVL